MPGKAKGVLRRASAWCAANGAIEDAIEYAHATAISTSWRHWSSVTSGRCTGPVVSRPSTDGCGGSTRMGSASGIRRSRCWPGSCRPSRAIARSRNSGWPLPRGRPSPDRCPTGPLTRSVDRDVARDDDAAGLALLEEDARIAHEEMAGDSPFMPGVRLLEALGVYLAESSRGQTGRSRKPSRWRRREARSPASVSPFGSKPRSHSVEATHGRPGSSRSGASVGSRARDWKTPTSVAPLRDRRSGSPGSRRSVEARTFIGRVNRSRPQLTSSLPWLSVLVRLETIRGVHRARRRCLGTDASEGDRRDPRGAARPGGRQRRCGSRPPGGRAGERLGRRSMDVDGGRTPIAGVPTHPSLVRQIADRLFGTTNTSNPRRSRSTAS